MKKESMVNEASIQLPHGICLSDLPKELELGIPFCVVGRKKRYVLQKSPPLDAFLFDEGTQRPINTNFIIQEAIDD